MADVEIKRIPRIDIKKAGSLVGTRPAVNLIEGTNVTLTVTDDGASNEVDVTVASSPVPSDFQPAIVTNNYYFCAGFNLSTDVITEDVLYAVPFWSSHAETWTRIGVNIVTPQAGASVRLGIFSNGTANKPGALLLDAGTIDASTGGAKEITISQALSANTVYWLSSINSTFEVAGTLTGADHTIDRRLGVDAISGGPPYAVNMAFGALPDPFGTPDDVQVASPAVWLRKV